MKQENPVTMLIFPVLLGAAGVVWGVFNAAALNGGGLQGLVTAGQGGSAEWAMPVALCLLLAAQWLAAYVILRDSWRAASTLHGTYPFVLPYLVSAAIISMFLGEHRDIMFASIICLILVGIIPLIVEMRRYRRERPKPDRTERWSQLRSAAGPMILMIAVSAALLAVVGWLIPSGGEDSTSLVYRAGGNLSILFPWMIGQTAAIDFPRLLVCALLVGAATGMWAGFFMAAMRPSIGDDFRKAYVCLAAGLVLGAVVAGMMFVSQAVMLIYRYDAAWNAAETLRMSLWVWGICGALTGLLLAATVHGFTADRNERPRQLVYAFCLAAIPILLAGNWTHSYMKVKDTGRAILAQADRQEGMALWVGLGQEVEHHPTPRDKNVVLLWIGSDDVSPVPVAGAYPTTVAACDRLIRDYPDSAYRSAALCLKCLCLTRAWQPTEALRSWEELVAEYPHQSYWSALSVASVVDAYVLTGDYERALQASRSLPDFNGRPYPSRSALYAAELLGHWDDVIRYHRIRIDEIRSQDSYLSRTDRKNIAEIQKKMDQAKVLKSRPFKPKPRTDVTGRVLVDGRPRAGLPVCIIPAQNLGVNGHIESCRGAAALGGRIAVTDTEGYYHVSQAPVGRYRPVVVLERDAFGERKWRVRGTRVPFKADGKRAVAPTVELF